MQLFSECLFTQFLCYYSNEDKNMTYNTANLDVLLDHEHFRAYQNVIYYKNPNHVHIS